MRSFRNIVRNPLVAMLAIVITAANLALSPLSASAAVGGELVRVSTAPFGEVHDVDYDAGRLAVANTEFDRVVIDGQTIGSTAGSLPGQFDDPRGIAFGPDAVYVSDSGNHRVQEFILFEGTWVYSQEWSLGATSDPRGIDVTSDGRVVVADAALNKIHAITPSVGVADFATGLSAPLGVAFDGTDIVVTNTGADALRKYNLAGTLDGSFSPAGLNDPADVTADRFGNLFVTELFADDIRAFDDSGAALFSFGGTGTGVDQFKDPRGIAIVDDSQLYIADSLNKRVELYRHSTVVSVASTTASVIEDAGSLDVTVNLSATTTAPVVIDVAAAPGTATTPADYSFADAPLSIPAGQTSGTVTIAIADDNNGAELPETFTVAISNPAFAVLGTNVTTTVTINDDDIVARPDNWATRADLGDISLITNRNNNLVVTAAKGVLTNDDNRLDVKVTDFPNMVDTNTVPSSGTVSVNDNGSFTYRPTTGFIGQATFNYTVIDGSATETALVSVRVNGPATAAPDSYSVGEDGSLDTFEAELNSVLFNDTDGDPSYTDPMHVASLVTNVSNGTLVLSTGPESNGHFVYTPNQNFNGTDSFTYTAADGRGSSATATVTLTVNEFNDAPSFSLTDQAVAEDAGAQSVAEADWLTDIDDGDPTASPADQQDMSFAITANSDADLFETGPTVAFVGDEWVLSYEAKANANGLATLEITGTDDGSTGLGHINATAADIDIAVGDVNDAPTVTPVDQTIDEDDGATTFTTATWASELSGTDPEIEEQLSFSLGDVVQDENNPAAFGIEGEPAIDAETGAITFTVAANDHGIFTLPITVTDDYNTKSTDDDESTTVDVQVTVDAVNDAPVVVTKPIAALEDPDPATESYAVTDWTSTLNDGDPTSDAADDQTLDYTLTSWTNADAPNDVVFEVDGEPAIDPATGAFTFTLLENENGSFTVNVDVGDDGGTSNGGTDSTSVSFLVTVDSVNDAPTFTLADQTVNEDAGAQTVAEADWITDILDGDPTTGPFDTQNVTIAVTGNDNADLFAVAPVSSSVDESWQLAYTPTDDAHGVANITVTATDDNGTQETEDDESTSETLIITVNSVNDAPTFTIPADDTVDEDAGAQSVDITDVSAGAANESGQVVSFAITGNSNHVLFETGPTVSFVDDAWQLSYTPADDANGTATVTVTATDDGGTDFGGDDDSEASITINVTPVNDAPTVTPAEQTFDEDDNDGDKTYTAAEWSDPAPTGTDPELDETLTYGLDSFAAGTVTFDTEPAVSTTGDLTFDVATNANGTFTVTIDVTDDNATPLNTDDDQTTQVTVTINVTPVNDAPTVTPTDQTVNEDEGPFAIDAADWAVDLDDGDPELVEGISFSLVGFDADSTLEFEQPAEPAVDPDTGEITFDVTADENGSFTATIAITDDNETTEIGEEADDLTTTVEVVVTVAAVNDAPSITVVDQGALEDAAPVSIAFESWASSTEDGDNPTTPSAADTQTLTYEVTANDNPDLFSAEPTIGIDNALTFTPAPNANAILNGDANITVTITDDGGTPLEESDDLTAEDDLVISITPVEDPVVAIDDEYIVDIDEDPFDDPDDNLIIDVFEGLLANDEANDVDGDRLEILSNEVPDFGEVAVAADGSISYDADPFYVGDALFTYVVTDNNDSSDTGTVLIKVNDRPTVKAGATLEYITDEDVDLEFTFAELALLFEDVAPDTVIDTVTFSDADNLDVGEGTLTIDGDEETVVYTPAADFTGTATFDLTVTDSRLTATTTLSVKVNAAPATDDDTAIVLEDHSVEISAAELISDDTDTADDVDDTVTFVGVDDGDSEGTVTFEAPDTIIYTPPADFNGPDSFTYTVTDGRLESTGTVNVTVTAVNDAPTFTLATDQMVIEDGEATSIDDFYTNEDEGGGSDEDSQILTLDVNNDSPGLFTSAPAIVDGNLSFETSPDAVGVATITVTLTDDGGTDNDGVDMTEKSFTIDVKPLNDAPIATLPESPDQTELEDSGLNTVADFVTDIGPGGGTDENTQTVTLTVTNDNNALFSIQPAVDIDGVLTYTPADNANGSAEVTLTFTDDGPTGPGHFNTTVMTFNIDITAVNDAPSFTPGANVTVDEDTGKTTITDWATDISSGPANESDQTTTFTLNNDSPSLFTSAPAILNGTLSFTVAPDADGVATITVTLTDDGGTDNDGVDTYPTPPTNIEMTITINDAPEANDDVYVTDRNVAIVVDAVDGLLDNDTDRDNPLVITSHSDPIGSLVLDQDGSFGYEPTSGFVGTDSFTYTIDDGRLQSTATVEIYVNGPPTATADGYTVDEDQLLTVPAISGLLANDFDTDTIDDDIQVVANTVNTTRGVSVTLAADGSFSYTPPANFHGSDSFVYGIEDDRSLQAAAVVTITVNSVNDAPVADNDSYTVERDATLTVAKAAGLLVGDVDVDGDTLTVSTTKATTVQGVEVTLNSDGSFSYTPPARYIGTDSFRYVATDSLLLSNLATVTITVEGPDLPVLEPVPFNDVPAGAYFHEPVQWAVACSITTGTSATTFSPDDVVTRAQFITFLFRLAGEPSVTNQIPFTDVPSSAYYASAVRWAYANNVTSGTSPTLFSPDGEIDRAQVVTLLHRYLGNPAADGDEAFSDVNPSHYFYNAVRWAVNTSDPVTTGTGPGLFSPFSPATRAQAVTFIRRANGPTCS